MIFSIIVGFAGVLMVFLILAALVSGFVNRGRNDAFLEWDPEATMEWRMEMEEEDAPRALAVYNRDRRASGQEPLTMDQYLEQMRRRAAPGD